MKVVHQLIEVRQEPDGPWSGACKCRKWVVFRGSEKDIRKAWEAHAREKGAR